MKWRASPRGTSACVVLATVFVIAPNIGADVSSVAASLVKEARPAHLGADGLGFGGNLLFYSKTCFANYGIVVTMLSLIGRVAIAVNPVRSGAIVLGSASS